MSYTKFAEVMKAAATSAMILVLLSVIALCPVLVCPPSGSCCHKPQTKTVPDCPYSILQKSKTSPTATHAKWAGTPVRSVTSATLPVAAFAVSVPSRLADASGLFLRNRVLLI